MRILRSEYLSALFSSLESASPDQLNPATYSVGYVHCLNRNLECVPFVVGASRFLLEVRTPHYLTQVEFHDSIVLKTKAGQMFLPKLDHRYLTVSSLLDGTELVNLCQTSKTQLPKDASALCNAIRTALVAFYRSYPNASQYFYLADTDGEPLLEQTFSTLPADFLSRYELIRFADLAEPYAGFSLTSKLL